MDAVDATKLTRAVLDSLFKQGGGPECANILVRHQIESFNEFLDKKLVQIIQGFNPIQVCHNYSAEYKDFRYKMYLNVIRPSLTKPMYQTSDGAQMLMTPHMARINNLTYACNLYVDVHIITEIINADGVIERNENTVTGVCIGKVPIMTRSKACVLTQMPTIADGVGIRNESGPGVKEECRFDYGGYFVVNGNEKVVISQDRISENKTLVFQPNCNGDGLNAEIRSMPDLVFLPPKTTSLHMAGKPNHMGHVIRLNASFLRSEIPLFVMFRALGIESDKEIYAHIVLDIDSKKNERIISELAACAEDASDVHTQEDALAVIRMVLGTTGTPKEYLDQPGRTTDIIKNTIKNDFLSHVGPSFKRKALYIGYMVHKLISIHLGYQPYDNRDSYLHKRIDTPGTLYANIFRQCYGKLIKDVRNLIVRELNLWRATPNVPLTLVTSNNIHRFFKQTVIESGLRYALSTGNWGVKSIGSFQNIRQGVAQVLNRMSYLSTLSHLRRISTPMEKNGKLVQPRKLENTQYGMVCPAECFAPNTPILLWDGTIKFAKDIIVGDYLIDDNGNSVRVRSTCSGFKTMYEIIPTKRNFMEYTVTDNHILTLKVRNHTRNPTTTNKKYTFRYFDPNKMKYLTKSFDNEDDLGTFASTVDDVIDITIEQYLSLPTSVRQNLYTFKSSGINWDYKEVTLDPYILGMWLGDGFSSGYGFATADKELLDKWIEWGKDNDATIKHGERYTYRISSTINNTQPGIACNKTESAPLKKLLEVYNLVKNKHIPLDYLVNDRKTRLALLAGIIDTDGNVRANGHEIRICQGEKNYQIIYDTEFLARSLGFSCYLSKGTSSYTVNGEKRHRPYKELRITGEYLYEIPTVLPRKKLNKFENETSRKKCSSYLQSPFQLIKKEVEPFNGWQLEGNGRFLLGDMSVGHNTPEGAPVGLVKNLAMSTHITNNTSSALIRDMLEEMGVRIYCDAIADSMEFLRRMGSIYSVKVMINGDLVGFHENPKEFYDQMKMLKVTGSIPPKTAVVWDIPKNLIHISTEAGRLCRPLYIVTDKTLRILQRKLPTDDFNALLLDETSAGADSKGGCIEFMDVDEVDKSMISMYPSDLYKSIKGSSVPPTYTHCEIHPSLMLGVLAGNIPFMNHNQSPRNCYQSAMGKQAVGIYASNFNNRTDTMAHVLHYPQRPLVNTQLSKYVNTENAPSGINAIVAIATYSGFNQEDSVMVNQSAIDRGMFSSTYFKSYRDQCSKNHSTGEEEVFMRPIVEQSGTATASASAGDGSKKVKAKPKPFNYDKLGPDGFVPKNTYVDPSDILVGKMMPHKVHGQIQYRDTSMQIKGNDDGYVDMNYTGTNGDGYKFCKVRLRKYRKPMIGDKLASKHAQKGTIGMVYRDSDMPFTKDGIRPDIIMNPHAVPSRMTIAQLMECIMAKASCGIGSYGDATPFNSCTVENIAEELEKSGYERYGNEILYDGRTGRQITTEIFIGPTYYQRLKHMVADKQHCLTLDHEVLTENGWMSYGDLSVDVRVATLKDGKLVYETPTKVLLYASYEGDMYHVKNDGIDLVVTMNHRMWVADTASDDFHMEFASEVAHKTVVYKKDAEWTDEGITATYPWIKSIEELRDYIDLHFGESYEAADAVMADHVMTMCIHAGWSANIDTSDERYSVKILKTPNDLRPSASADDGTVYKFKGPVFCLQVPSEVFMVRRNGKAVWTGNSRSSNGPIVMLTRQPAEGRARNGGLRFGEMERDATVAHGSGLFLKERMLDVSDNFRVFPCRRCGMVSIANPEKNIYKCPSCKSAADIVQIRIPFCFKLLMQELESMSVAMRFCF